MPSSSRRTTSRRQNSEEIEDDVVTQRQADDDVSDGEGPSRTATQSRKKYGKQKKVTQNTQDSDDDDEVSESDGDDEQIDVSQLRDQPLPAANEAGLRGLCVDWKNVEFSTRQHWSMIQDIASALADNVDEEAAREPIESLDSVMRELIDLSTEMISHKEVIDDMRQKLVQGQKIDNALDRYMSGVEAKKEEYQKKTTRQKYAKSDAYIEFRSSIWNAQKPGQPMPPLTTFIEKEDGDDSDDDDLEIGGQTQDFKCPITLTILIDPLTSRLCGHSYDAAAIRSMLGRGSKACPAAGCKKMITISDCLPNEDLAKKAKNHKRRLERQEEEAHSDVDEVIE